MLLSESVYKDAIDPVLVGTYFFFWLVICAQMSISLGLPGTYSIYCKRSGYGKGAGHTGHGKEQRKMQA